MLRFTVPSEIELSDVTRMKDVLVATLETKEPDSHKYTVRYRGLPHAGADTIEFEQPFKVKVDAAKLEQQVVEVTRAMQDPSLTDSQRAEFTQKLANAQHQLVELREVHAEPKEMFDKAALETLRLSRVTADRVSPELVKMIQDRSGVKVGDQISEEVLKQIVAAADSVDEHFHVRWERDGKGGLVVFIVAP